MNLPGFFQNEPNIHSVKYKRSIDEQLVDKLIYYIQSACKKSTKVIVEINSGINSLAAGVLFKKALGEKAIAIIVDLDAAKTNNLANICQNLGFNTYILKRSTAYQNELAAYHLTKQEDIRRFYKRFINYHLLTAADHMKAELTDTACKSDRLATLRPEGFYGHFAPFYCLYKTEVYDLAKLLGISYEYSEEDKYFTKIDPILYLLEHQKTPEEISQEFKIDLQWLKKLKSHIDKQSFETPVSQFII
ncbi:hypothetical protein HY383_01495 [Candidatus Daviesbacteria bacterium]|nr:hypothetical protein [Candidatus Daviesbacteria bacterium]